MTREEQIITEAKKYYSDSINCHNAFLHGVEWADKYPVNVWHDASKEPRLNEPMLGEDSEGFSIYKWVGQEDCWSTFVDMFGLNRWAYISDLVPKGGNDEND